MSTVTLPKYRREQEKGPQTPNHLLGNGSPKSRTETSSNRLVPAIIDFLLICASGLLAFALRFSPGLSQALRFPERPIVRGNELTSVHLGFLLLYIALLLLASHWQNLYRPDSKRSFPTETERVIRAVTIATVVLTTFIYLSGIKTVSRLFVGFTAVISTLALITWRANRAYLRKKQFARGQGCQHALIVGAGKVGQHLAAYLEENPAFGYKVKGFLDSNHHDDPRILGKMDDLKRVARQEFIDEVFITIPSERELVKRIALEADGLSLGLKVIPELYDGLGWLSPFEFIGDFPVSVLRRETLPAYGVFLKRAMDIVGAAMGLALFSPVLLATAIAIKSDSHGPVFYRACRVGRKGRRFVCYKFRTMVPDADIKKKELAHLNERVGPLFKLTSDPRVTRLGSFLRKYSLDELPQFWNVLKGDMSLVGPRPPEVDEIGDYKLEHLRRLEVTPGVTGLWQVSARHDPSFETTVALDNRYIENWSLMLDLQILLKTVPVVFKGLGR